MNKRFRNFESRAIVHILLSTLSLPLLIHWLPTAMENQIDRTIRLMAFAAGLVGILVIVVFQFL